MVAGPRTLENQQQTILVYPARLQASVLEEVNTDSAGKTPVDIHQHPINNNSESSSSEDSDSEDSSDSSRPVKDIAVWWKIDGAKRHKTQVSIRIQQIAESADNKESKSHDEDSSSTSSMEESTETVDSINEKESVEFNTRINAGTIMGDGVTPRSKPKSGIRCTMCGQEYHTEADCTMNAVNYNQRRNPNGNPLALWKYAGIKNTQVRKGFLE